MILLLEDWLKSSVRFQALMILNSLGMEISIWKKLDFKTLKLTLLTLRKNSFILLGNHMCFLRMLSQGTILWTWSILIIWDMQMIEWLNLSALISSNEFTLQDLQLFSVLIMSFWLGKCLKNWTLFTRDQSKLLSDTFMADLQRI